MFSQFLSRLWRIARANEAAARGRGDELNLHEAEALIEEARRRDEPQIDIPQPKRAPDPRPQGESRPDPEPPGAAPVEMTYDRAIAILRVRQGATMEEVTGAYRRIIIEHHPDRTSHLGAEEQSRGEARTRELNVAYAFLKDYFSRGT